MCLAENAPWTFLFIFQVSQDVYGIIDEGVHLITTTFKFDGIYVSSSEGQ